MKLYKISYISAAIVSMLLGATNSFAGASAKIQVSATVLPFVSFHAAQHVTTYQVHGEDIRRGYIDLPNAITVSVKTNVTGGLPVIVDSTGGGRILVKESGMGSYSDSIFTVNTASYRPNTLISKNYDSRIVLSADAQEGVYPLAISMTPAI